MGSVRTFRIRVTESSPETFGMSELGELLTGLDKAIRAMVPDLASELTMGVVGIGTGSTMVEVLSNRPEETKVALSTIGEAVSHRRPEALPPATRTGLQQVTHVLSRRVEDSKKPALQLLPAEEMDSTPFGVITPDMDFHYEPPKVLGETTLYGIPTLIGGEHPRVHVRLMSGQLLICAISRDTARALAPRLYEEVGLEGQAEWNTEDWSVESFKVRSITPYKAGSLTGSIEALSSAIGEGWDDVEDVVEEIRKMRQEHEQ